MSVVEKTSSRRVFRKLLAVVVEVEFAITVQDAAAQAAMIAIDGLTETKLNTDFSKQVFPRFCVLLPQGLVCLQHTVRARVSSGDQVCVCSAYSVCSAIQQGLPHARVLTERWCVVDRETLCVSL